MKVVRTIADARAALEPLRADSIGLVATMGSLHEGHLALLRAARAENDTVVMSLFVNPAQFGEEADLARYPRDEGHDLDIAREAGVDLVFAPSTDEMYPPGFQTWVDVTELGAILEGRFRPGHFKGVATVVLKLFNVVRPHARVLRTEGRPAGRGDPADDPRPRARSRAARRSDGPRRGRPRAVFAKRPPLARGESSRRRAPPALATRDRDVALARLAEAGLEIDYVEIADFDPPALVGAVRVGSTRLIDNVVLEGDTE